MPSATMLCFTSPFYYNLQGKYANATLFCKRRQQLFSKFYEVVLTIFFLF